MIEIKKFTFNTEMFDVKNWLAQDHIMLLAENIIPFNSNFF